MILLILPAWLVVPRITIQSVAVYPHQHRLIYSRVREWSQGVAQAPIVVEGVVALPLIAIVYLQPPHQALPALSHASVEYVGMKLMVLVGGLRYQATAQSLAPAILPLKIPRMILAKRSTFRVEEIPPALLHQRAPQPLRKWIGIAWVVRTIVM
jgi:hypothetical protein